MSMDMRIVVTHYFFSAGTGIIRMDCKYGDPLMEDRIVYRICALKRSNTIDNIEYIFNWGSEFLSYAGQALLNNGDMTPREKRIV